MAVALSCAHASPRPAAPFRRASPYTTTLRVIRVAIDHVSLGYSLDGRIVSAFAPLRAAGYDFRYAAAGEPYQILVTRLATTRCGSGARLGEWRRLQQQVAIAPECLTDDAALRWVMVHEFLHSRNCLHVCRTPDEVLVQRRVGDPCSGVPFGRAVLNPLSDYDGEDSPSELTSLDMAELHRVGAVP